jgi:hypothetical protein
MLKISRIRPCEYNRNCSTLHHESKKIEFAFFWSFYDFLRILQVSAKWVHYWSYSFALRPLEVSADSQPYPYFAQNPPEISQTSQCGPRAPAGGGPAKFRRTSGRDRPGAGGEWPSGPWGSIPVLGLGRGTTGERARRSPTAVAAGPRVPAK